MKIMLTFDFYLLFDIRISDSAACITNEEKQLLKHCYNVVNGLHNL